MSKHMGCQAATHVCIITYICIITFPMFVSDFWFIVLVVVKSHDKPFHQDHLCYSPGVAIFSNFNHQADQVFISVAPVVSWISKCSCLVSCAVLDQVVLRRILP